jgi:nucleotide-binding universal stress UspA family protein
MKEKYLVAIDGSDHALKALDLAGKLAKATDASLRVIHVLREEHMPAGLEEFAASEGLEIEELQARRRFDRLYGDRLVIDAANRLRNMGIKEVDTEVIDGNPAEEITRIAEREQADLLFMGSRGLSDFKGLVIGSTSHKVMNLAPCSCVAVK